jgi:hypothetical protein
MDRSGKIIPEALATQYSETMWGIIKKAIGYSVEHSDQIDPSESLFDFMSEVGKGVIDSEPDSGIDLKTLLECSELWSAYVGEDIRKQSLKHLFLEECIEGKNLFVAGTYRSILAHIAATALSKSDLHLNTTVTNIKSDDTDSDVSIKTSSGATRSFNEVVLTTPLGWLKRHTQAFEPPLSPRLLSAISSLGYGRLEKVLFTFEDAFWRSETDDSESDAWQSLEGFAQWLNPEYSKKTNPSQFYLSALELSSLESNGHPTLLFYVSGPCSTYLSSTTKDKTAKERLEFLKDFFEPYYSRLPNYTNQQPRHVVSTSWQTDELAGNGSYTQIPVGTTQADKDVQVIREGLPERRLWFAGEHTAPFLALGTTTGAYFSGEAIARRIIRAYGIEESK